ncbi:hypothetical protein EBZ38_03185 [bacterium]|nr:hypothetical protein [bacterium]NDC93896.1 hypothetical protein [bacterium]NDD83270.1 hypothetical protein [bacterium]
MNSSDIKNFIQTIFPNVFLALVRLKNFDRQVHRIFMEEKDPGKYLRLVAEYNRRTADMDANLGNDYIGNLAQRYKSLHKEYTVESYELVTSLGWDIAYKYTDILEDII